MSANCNADMMPSFPTGLTFAGIARLTNDKTQSQAGASTAAPPRAMGKVMVAFTCQPQPVIFLK